MSRINATSDPLSTTMQAMNSAYQQARLQFNNAVRNSTIISTDASSTLTPPAR